MQTGSLAAGAPPMDALGPVEDPLWSDGTLLDLFERLKRESMEGRHVFEREWTRDLWYVANRQWITYHPTRREWVDKRLQKWIPRPVTNKMAEVLQSIRTNLIAINLNIKARPVGSSAQAIAAAEIADQLAPVIHEEHAMSQVMREADFWLISTGNAVLQISWDKDKRTNRTFVAHDQCQVCGTVSPPQAIVDAGQTCPAPGPDGFTPCGSNQFAPGQNPDGTPAGEYIAFGKGKTAALSPFEYLFPPHVTRWDDIPYLIRIRWRDKHWYDANMPEIVSKITWEKSSTDRSLQIFKSLATSNDVGSNSAVASFGITGGSGSEGITEYELWLKPTPDYPKGLVMRVAGDKNPIILDIPNEGIPGPFPYVDIEDNPLFPFVHAQYEHMGGRLLGRSALSPLVQKQDQLNQLDSLIQLIVQRMANPIWVVPNNAGIEHFTGEPGLIMKWNPLAAGGNAKPERVPGSDVPGSLQTLRQQILQDIEELSGAFDIIKGQKPSGVEAFSALQLLVERSQSRFTAVFQSRGEMYRKWAALALELERKFGPEQRTWSITGSNRGYTFRHFENAQLQGQITLAIEDGSNMPKTALGKRAAIEQANQLGLLDPSDPDQKYTLLSTFGLSELVPTLNSHVQTAQQMQDAFEKWAQAPAGPPPLVVKRWYDAQIHWTERVKWLNTDRMREILAANPQLEQVIDFHLQELQMILAPPPVDPETGQPIGPGGAGALNSSNQESGAVDTLPSGNNQYGPNQGPR